MARTTQEIQWPTCAVETKARVHTGAVKSADMVLLLYVFLLPCRYLLAGGTKESGWEDTSTNIRVQFYCSDNHAGNSKSRRSVEE